VAALGPLLEASGTKIWDAGSQLQFVWPRIGSALEAPVQEICETPWPGTGMWEARR